MEPLILNFLDGLATTSAFMRIEEVGWPAGGLHDYAWEVRASVYLHAGEEVAITFLVFHSRSIKKFRHIIGETVTIELTGWFRGEGRFEPDALRLPEVRALRRSWYSPRKRTVR